MEELAQNPNPLAAIVQAHRTAQIAKKDVGVRYTSKLSLIKSLFERGYGKGDIVQLFRLIDWFIALPKFEEEQLWQEIETLKEDKKMPYITSYERIVIEKKLQQGQIMNARNNIVQVLEVRFEGVTQELKQTIEKFDDLELLGELLTQAVKSPSLEVFESIASQKTAEGKLLAEED
ncbi:MAG: hypothetical protein F6J96_23585 [Symploca sp. SIO1C2]|nr:hypothetical protein [Symploca sp. SIO1C2]